MLNLKNPQVVRALAVLAEGRRILENDARATRAKNDPCGATAHGGTDPIGQWNAVIAAKCTAGLSKSAAVRAVAIADPELHSAYIVAVNARR